MNDNFISSVWDFKQVSLNETGYLTHDFLRWYGKLIPQLASRLIKLYSEENELVLANFAGSGTVLIESNVLKRNVIGIDSSPLSILLCKVKTTAYKPNSTKFLLSLKEYIEENKDKQFEMDKFDKKWYDPNTFNKMMLIKERIKKIKEENERNYYLVALAAITRKISNVDSRSINHIVIDKNKAKTDVLDEFSQKIADMNESMEEYIKVATRASVLVKRGDARNIDQINDNSIDLIISHPPYLGHINYSNIFSLANKIIGHEYSDLRENDISTNNLDKYMVNMKKVFDEMSRVLKSKKYACVIIGDNRVNGNVVPTFSYFINYASEKGFKLKDIFIWVMNQKAGMSIKRRGNHMDHNYILIFQKA
jgi:DNA modification methylase